MRFVLTLLLAIVCTPAWAEWVKMGEADKSTLFFMTSATAYYIDPGSVTRNGVLRKVWEIHDLRDKGTRGERSIMTSVEYDCAAKQMRTVSATGHSRRMAQGEIIALAQAAGEWIPLLSGKDYEVFFKILERICAP